MPDRFADACPVCGAQGQEICATPSGRDHRKRILLLLELDRQQGADRTIRQGDDEFAPGECDGSGTCAAPIHVHGCYTPHRSDQCDSPDEYGHTDHTICTCASAFGEFIGCKLHGIEADDTNRSEETR